MTHTVSIRGYTALPSQLQLGTVDSYGVEDLQLKFDDIWAGLAVTATFTAPDGTPTDALVGMDGAVKVPHEATCNGAGQGVIVLRGCRDGLQIISCNIHFFTKEHGPVNGMEAVDPTPDKWQQFVDEVQDDREAANKAAQDAAASADRAEAAAENAENAAQTAADAAGVAGQAANAANESVKAAQTAQGSAESAAQSAAGSARAAADSAAAAKKSAEDAAASSKSAAGKAEASESSANAANESAKAAQTAQGSAENAAQTAANAAGAAGQAAGEAAQSAKAAETAKQRAEDAAKKALEAKTGSENALRDADAAKNAASGYAAAAAERATAAAASEKNAAKSANSAADSAAAAKKSAEDADNTANSIKDSMAQISENKEAVSQLKEDTAALKKRQNVLVGSETGNPVSCNDAYSAPLCGLTVYGNSTQDGTPSPDNPVPIVSAGDDGSVAVKVTGKNRMPTNLMLSEEVDCFIEKNTMVHLTFKDGIISRGGNLLFIGENNEEMWFAIDAGVTEVHRSLMITAIKYRYLILDMASENVCLTWNASSPDYEPYREQLLTLPTPNGLPGIPVTSGGNYTDQNGQQWICDEVDLERGVKVQRVTTIVFSDGTKFTLRTTSTSTKFRFSTAADGLKTANLTTADSSAFCSALALGKQGSTWTIPNTFTIDADGRLYVRFENINSLYELQQYLQRTPMSLTAILATPIETPLSPAEIAAYKALTAYAPDTVVQASDGAGIKLDYQRDVNLVVKNLEDAIASMTTTT